MLARNLWYVAAWSDEVGSQPLARRFLGDPVVLFRTAGGKVAALADRCCHRGAPLAFGRVLGENIQCGYHGLEFDGTGKCVKIPGQEKIPPVAAVRSYPVAELDSIVWIWMGDPQRANPEDIVRYPWHQDSGWRWKANRFLMKCNHVLLYDNLLDLTHLGYVHAKTIGGDPDTHAKAEMKFTRSERGVTLTRWMLACTPPATFAKAVAFKGKVDRWQELVFQPGSVHLWAGATDAGTGAYEGRREGGFGSRTFHGITPETEHSSHYFWSAAHNFRLDEPGVTENHFQHLNATFEEDRAIIEAQYERLREDPSFQLVHVQTDAPALQMRRILARLADEERSAAAASAG